MNHLEYDWDGPVWPELFRRMSADHTLIRYDERGNGLSDWNEPAFERLAGEIQAYLARDA